MKFLEGYRKARQEVNCQRAEKKAREAKGFLYYTAIGRKQRDDLLSDGWELISQDMSESGSWITQWFMRRSMKEPSEQA